MRIISYYTRNYAKQAKRLIRSAKKFNHSIKVIKIKEKGCWGFKVKHKPSIILKEYLKYGGNFLYLDVDTLILKRLDNLFNQIKINDFCIRTETFAGEYNLGVIGVGNHPQILAFLKQWNNLVIKDFGKNKTVDQVPFASLIQNFNFNIYDLGRAYNLLPGDRSYFNIDDVYIYHYKSSRKNNDHDKWLKIIDNTQY